MQNEHRKRGSANISLAAIIAGTLFVALWYAFTSSPKNGTLINGTTNANLQAYIGISVCFVVCFGAVAGITSLFPREKRNIINAVLEIIVIGIILVCLGWQFTVEEQLWPGNGAAYIRHNIPGEMIYFGILFLAFYMVIRARNQFMVDMRGRIVFGILLASVTAVCQYCPNPFYDGGGWMYHYDAYANSIFNVMHGNPYSDVNLSIYGHYALFYAPVAKLLGGGTLGVARAISAYTFLAIAATEFAIAKLIKRDNIYLVTALAAPAGMVMVYLNGVYNQVAPHRYVFPAILIAYVSYAKWNHEQKNKKIISELLGWIVCTLAVIWNTETGLFCCIGYSAFLLYLYMDKQEKVNVKIIGMFLRLVLLDIVVCMAAYCVVNVYNLLAGGTWISIMTYIYPMLASEYNINDLLAQLPLGVNSYIFEMLLFLIAGCAVFAMLGMFTRKEKSNIPAEKRALILLTSLIGMGCFTYYINRPAYCNMSISYLEAVILIGIVAELFWNEWGRKRKEGEKNILAAGMSGISILVLVALAIGTLTYSGVNMEVKRKTSWNTEALIEASLPVYNTVPEGTFAFGQGVWLVYGLFQWDTRCAAIDFEDMNWKASEYILERLEEEKSFFMESTSPDIIGGLDLSQFEQKASFSICGKTYEYYERIKNEY